MKSEKHGLLITSAILSVIAASLTFASLLTEQWAISRIILNPFNTESDKIKIGLFSGIFSQNTETKATFELTMTCIFSLNVCALLCGSEEDRYKNLWSIYYNQYPVDVNMDECGIIVYDRELLLDFYYRHIRNSVSENEEKYFINAGLWLCVVITLVASILFGLASAALAFYNSNHRVTNRIFGIFGLYIYTALSGFFVVLGIILWTVIFSGTLRHNVPTYQTFVYGFNTDNYAQMGFSFFFNVLSVFLYCASVFFVFVRSFILSKNVYGNKQDLPLN